MYNKLDIHGSMHHSIIHTEITNKMQQCIRIYCSMFVWSSACFEWQTAHHRELKNCNLNVQQPHTHVTPEAANAVLELLMMSGLLLKTCW